MRKPLLALAAACLALVPAAPAEAIQFASSSTTGKPVLFVPLRTTGMIFGPIGYSFGLRFSPGVADVLGPLKLPTGYSEVSSFIGDADLALRYRYVLADVEFLGRFNPSISPFLGYRGIGTVTGTAAASTAAIGAAGGFTNVHGLHYGVGADTELPLGFSAFGNLGFTTLLGGGYNATAVGAAASSGPISPAGATLPILGLGAAWQLGPVFRVSVGYDVFALPTKMREHSPVLGSGLTWITGLNLGITLFGLSF